MLFSRESIESYRSGLIGFLRTYMLQYLNDHPEDGDDVVPIFSDIREQIKNASDREIRKIKRKTNNNVMIPVLNMLHSYCMYFIKKQSFGDSLRAQLRREEQPALKLYNAINEFKLDKGLITQKQFDENMKLGKELSMYNPLTDFNF
jgi:hypothetical protein